MERLTERLENGVINVKYASQHETAIHRLATIEDILGDEYDLDRLRELVQADREGRCVEPQRYWEATLRHALAAWDNYEAIDDESGLPHLAHMACDIAFILQIMKENKT